MQILLSLVMLCNNNIVILHYVIHSYVIWNGHERQQGIYDFKGQQDLGKFLTAAQDEGLLVIIRAGPYICGEWEYVCIILVLVSLLNLNM